VFVVGSQVVGDRGAKSQALRIRGLVQNLLEAAQREETALYGRAIEAERCLSGRKVGVDQGQRLLPWEGAGLRALIGRAEDVYRGIIYRILVRRCGVEVKQRVLPRSQFQVGDPRESIDLREASAAS